MQKINIIDAKDYVGKTVKIGVWLTDKRSSGKISFLQLRDGTAFFQGIVLKNNIGEELFFEIKHISQETSMNVVGEIHEDTRSDFGYEIEISSLEIINKSEDYPITPKEHGIEYLMNNRHLWLRSKKPHAMMVIRNEIIRATYEFFNNESFIKIDAPIITGSAPEGTTELFKTQYFDKEAFLSQSGQLYEEAGAMAFNKVFSFGPTFRAEKSKTRRHLIEFWMIEPEMAFTHQEESLNVQENYVKFLIKNVLKNCTYELNLLGRNIDTLKAYTEDNYPRISYDKAIEMLKNTDEFSDSTWGDDFGAPEETYLASQFKQPVFVLNYPKKIKPFYMKSHPTDSNLYVCSDMLAPEGYGEIIGGSERETDYNQLLTNIKNAGLDPEDYKWYLDLRKYGSVYHSGFGLGLERMVTWICGEKHIRESIPFPRLLNRLTP